MNEQLKDKFPGLAPFQAEFVEQVLDTVAPAILTLQGPAGSGVTTTLCHAAAFGIAMGRFRRVLYVAPRGLIYQVRDTTERADGPVPCYVVDKKQLREFQSSAEVDESIWPTQGVFLVSPEFASRDEQVGVFREAEWDLVVIDEAERFANRRGAKHEFLSLLLQQETGLLVLGNRIRSRRFEDLIVLLPDQANHVIWNPDQLQNWEGEALPSPSIVWTTVKYEMNEREAAFYDQLEDATRSIYESMLRRLPFSPGLFLHRAMSCLYSVEDVLMEQRHRLRRQRNELAHGAGLTPRQPTLFDIEPEEQQLSLFADELNEESIAELNAAIEKIESLLNSLEDLDTDSKFEATMVLLDSIDASHVLIISQYDSTLAYLETELEDARPGCLSASGRLQPKELEERLRQFNSQGGLMLATDVALKGFELPAVSAVIHYDLPMNPDRMYLRLSRFQRVGRSGEIRMYALVESNSVTGRLWEKQLALATDFDSGT
jgi:superfamily II DNA or RNA helicase